MGSIRTSANATWRDFTTDLVPGSGDHEPIKSDIRDTMGVVEDRVNTAIEGASGAFIIKETEADLDADLDHAAGTWGRVLTGAGEGYYEKQGASGAGSWTFVTIDPAVAAAAVAVAAQTDAEAARDLAQGYAANAAAATAGQFPAVVTAFYPCDEGGGDTLRDVFGGADISLAGKSGAAWTEEGILTLTAEFFLTPSLTATTMFMVVRQNINANAGYLLAFPAGTAVGQNASGGAGWTSCRSLSGLGVHDIHARADASGSGAYELNAGGWVAPMVSKAAETGTFVIGAGNTGGAGPADFFEIAGFGFASANPSAAEATQIRTELQRRLTPRAIYMTTRSAPTYAELTLITGESPAAGTIARSILSPTEKLTYSQNTFIIPKDSGAGGTANIRMARLWFSDAAHNCSYAPSGDRIGLEWGFMLAQNLRADYGLPCHVLKVGVGSTYSAPQGTYTGADGAPFIVQASQSRNNDSGSPTTAMSIFWSIEDAAYHRAEQGARNQGIGYVVVTVIESDGLNDAYIGTGAVTSNGVVQGWMQSRYDARKAGWGITNLKQIQLYPHLPQGGVGGGDSDYPAGAVGNDRYTAITRHRAGQAAFVAANAADVQGLDTNDFARYPLDNSAPYNDWVHWSKVGYENVAIDAHALIPWNVQVIGA